VANPFKTRKKRLSSECAVSLLCYPVMTPLTPPPPIKNARRAAAAGHKTTQRHLLPSVRRRTYEQYRVAQNNALKRVNKHNGRVLKIQLDYKICTGTF